MAANRGFTVPVVALSYRNWVTLYSGNLGTRSEGTTEREWKSVFASLFAAATQAIQRTPHIHDKTGTVL